MVLLIRRNWSRSAARYEGVWLVLFVGLAACGSSVIPNHPLAYNGHPGQNSTVDHLELTSEDYIANQTQSDVITEYVTENQDPNFITDPDIPNTTLHLNTSVEDSYLTEYNVTENSAGYKMPDVSSTTFTTGIIVGICLLVIIVAVLVGAISFILYRHTMWNRPQTLSDKCSNDESTGYIDDTFRENSEEMYSLDNDSFLNSLEAMTIQNYWTDHVKHTKL